MVKIESNKKTADRAEEIVKNRFKRRGIKVRKAGPRAGYDLKAGNLLIEVKGTRQRVEQKHYFYMTEGEYKFACKHKNYWVYWVDVEKRGKTYPIPQKYILDRHNIKESKHYLLYLANFKKTIRDLAQSSRKTGRKAKFKYTPTKWHPKGVWKKKSTALGVMKTMSGKHKRIVKKNGRYYGYNLIYKDL